MSPADQTASNGFATLSGIFIFLESPSKKWGWEKKGWGAGGSRRGCWREKWRKSSSWNAKPNIPPAPPNLPPPNLFLFFFFLPPRRRILFSSQLYSWVIVQSSANGLCQAVVTLQSYWQERWQVGEDYKGTLHDIFWWADYSEISQELKYITLFWNSQPCQHTGQLTWAAAFSPPQCCWPVH